MPGIAKRATIEIPIKTDGLEKLNDLNKSLDRITNRSSSFKRSFADTSEELRKFNDRAQEFGERYEDMMKDTSSSNREFAKSNRDMADRFNESQRDMQASLSRTREAQDRLEKAGTRTTGTVSRGHERMNESMKASNDRLDKLNRSGSSMISNGMNASMTVAGLGGLFYKGAQGAQQLQQEYKIIYNLATYGGERASEAQRNVNKMQQQGAKISKQYGIAQTDISQGNETLLRRGYTTNEVLGSQTEYVRGAIASHDDYKDVIQSASNALDQFNLRTNNPQKMQQNTKTVLNQMTYGADQTAAGYKDMGYAMSYVGTIASQSHQSLAQTSADIGELSNRGLEGSKAGTGMRRVLEGLSKPKTKVLSTIGLTPQDLQDAHGNLRSVQQDMAIINQHSKDLSSSQRVNLFQSLFGTTGYHAGLILANNDNKLKSLNAHISQSQNMGRNHQGYNAILAQKNMDTFQNQIKRMVQSFNVFSQSVVQQMLPSLTKWAKRLNGLFSIMSNMSNTQKKFVGWTTGITVAIAPVTLVFGGLIKSLASVGKSFRWLRREMGAPMPSTATDSISEQAGQNFASSSEDNPALGNSSRSTFMTRNSSLLGRSDNIAQHARPMNYSRNLSLGEDASNDLGRYSRVGSEGVSALGRYSQSGGASRITNGLARSSRGIRGLSSKIPYLDLITSALPLIGMNKHNAGSKIGNAGGTLGGIEGGSALGAGLGSIVPFLGTGIGSLAGGGIGGIAGSSFGQKAGSAIGRLFRGRQAPQAHTDNSLSNRLSNELSDANVRSGVVANNHGTNPQSDPTGMNSSFNNRLIKQNQSTYSTMEGQLNNYVRNNESQSEKDLKQLQKTGGLRIKNAKQVAERGARIQSGNLKDANKYLNRLSHDHNASGNQRSADERKAQQAITRLMARGSSNQTILYGRLRDRTGRLSNQQASKVIGSSYRTMRSTIGNANSTYRSVIKSAQKRKNQGIANADREYYVNHTISKKQHDRLVSNYNDTAQQAITSAQNSKDNTISNAQEQHQKVVNEAKQQSADHLKYVNQETGSIQTRWTHLLDWFKKLWDWIKKFWHDLEYGRLGLMNPKKGTASHDISELFNGAFGGVNIGGSKSQVPTNQHARDMRQAGIPKSQQGNMNYLINRESSWNTHAQNSSGAYGIPQSLPSSKLLNTTKYGKDPRSNPVTQLRWMKDYVDHRYGNAKNASAHEASQNWYGNGGWANRPSIFGEASGQPEIAINPARDSADSLIQQAIQARAKYHKSQTNKQATQSMQSDIGNMMNTQSHGTQKPINVTQNITITGNADRDTARHIGQSTKQAIKQVIDEYMGNKNDAIFNS